MTKKIKSFAKKKKKSVHCHLSNKFVEVLKEQQFQHLNHVCVKAKIIFYRLKSNPSFKNCSKQKSQLERNIGVNPHKELFDISLPQSTFQFNQVTYLVLMVFCQTQIPVCLVFLAGL